MHVILYNTIHCCVTHIHASLSIRDTHTALYSTYSNDSLCFHSYISRTYYLFLKPTRRYRYRTSLTIAIAIIIIGYSTDVQTAANDMGIRSTNTGNIQPRAYPNSHVASSTYCCHLPSFVIALILAQLIRRTSYTYARLRRDSNREHVIRHSSGTAISATVTYGPL